MGIRSAAASLRVVVASGTLVCVAGAAACSEVTAPNPIVRDTDALFQTDSLAYTLVGDALGWGGRIAYTFTNRSPDTVSFVNCGGATLLWLEKWDGSGWQIVWSPVIPLCLSPPIVAAPGVTLTDTVSVWAAYPGQNAIPAATAEQLTGTHRLVWRNVVHNYGTCVDLENPFGPRLPLSQRVSNPFRLSVQR